MKDRKPRTSENKPARKKLRLSKETLRDLTDAKGSVKGGLARARTETCQAAGPSNCPCTS